ncbi:hypothetical protein SEA_DIZZYRUDY_69 [Microbacterium phage DizzyRudy]|nr:hypothetical protein SEA_DIZZYRUDY_69 [Microbacterium phage DizzyRudy]
MAPCPDIEPEDQSAFQLVADAVKPRETSTFPEPRVDTGSDAYRRGYEEARDLIPMRAGEAHPTMEAQRDYEFGYHKGISEKASEGAISVNRARWFMGLLEPAVPAQPAFDAVKIPQHYNTGQIEVANFIADQGLDYVSGNVIKYVARAGKKDPAKEVEDLEKAAAYLQMRHNLAKGLPAVVRDPETREVVWSLFRN